MGLVKLTYYSLPSGLRDKLGMTDNTLVIDLPHTFNVQIKKGVMDMTLPSESGITAEEIQASGSMIMAMGGTSRQISIKFTIKGDTHDEFVKAFNRIYAFLSVISIGDAIGLTMEDLVVDDPSDELNYGLWRNVKCVFRGASFSYAEGIPNAATVTINLIIGEVI